MTAPSDQNSAHVQYRIELPQQRYLDFDPKRVMFLEATIHDDVLGSGKSSHVFSTSDVNFLARVKSAMSGADPVLSFRIGFGAAQSATWLPWQSHIITDHYAKFEGRGNTAGHVLVINSDNNLVRMRRANRVTVRKGRISAMVESIAADHGLKAVVEPTKGDFSFIQNFTDDVRFIQERIMPRALNDAGRGGYFLFIKDNILHFHTADYQSSVYNLDYYNTTSISLEAADQSQNAELWDIGMAGITMVVHDPYSGSSAELKADPSAYLRLADSAYKFDAIKGGAWNVPYHLGSNPKTEVNAMAQSAYQKARMQAFKTMVVLKQTGEIRHGDILNLVASQQGSRDSDYAGLYYISGVTTSIKKGDLTSVLLLKRGETQSTEGALSTQDATKQLVPESKAAGVLPNLKEVNSSQLTKGAGNRASARIYSTVADAQKGTSP